jgi:hypothetical protein
MAAMELRPRMKGLADMPAIDAMEAVLRNWRRDRSNLFIIVGLLKGFLSSLWQKSRVQKIHPSGLNPSCFLRLYGTTIVVPFQNRTSAPRR